ncbi:sugar transferase [Malaciobacter molluscorum]|uniref:sugar transferase n=1 Tax=Malaciobacter molluscorum TaxID=1032072 RepID=UPI00100C18E6|nr:sugar transferase [Malaciobacter molluscorum]RXJ92874.1 sugar transferase [Malaciobacter molluscorum]
MYKLLFKRLIDFIVSFILFILLLVPFIVISILIKLDSKGNVFYRQVRVGQNCKEFKIFKFRTMVSNADQIGGYITSKNDSRITKIGQFLRKTSLDELPQVINVILGDMSLIGPRPDVPTQKINYTLNEWTKRHITRPGISGLAQCRNRHNITNSGRKKYDLFYNKKVNLILDIKIVLWTLKVLKKGSF